MCARTALQVYAAHKALMDLVCDLPDVEGYDDEVSDVEDITALLDRAHDDLHDVAARTSQRLDIETTPEAFR